MYSTLDLADLATPRILVRLFCVAYRVPVSELPMFVESFLRELPQLYNINFFMFSNVICMMVRNTVSIKSKHLHLPYITNANCL
jgi:hypothetical protein